MVAATGKSTKKRPAVSQGGPKPKKVHVDKTAPKSDKKRSRPVTLPAREVRDASDSDEEDFEDDAEALDEADEEMQDEFPMEVDEAPANKTPKDPAASRESHKTQKSPPRATTGSKAALDFARRRQARMVSGERQKRILR
ncbi:ARM repeat-containing protein [Mycena venus]|uniref:ARM repeat-containing protein n=1 Tax=Mycena venus TaxID=2733690 RepID=A0A8H6Z423_9AGAR|nr:ARM repeat-containing protein [Mycena venus]